MLTTIRVEEAVGTVLAHDITEIRRGEFKGRAFKKGHLIRKEDVGHFKDLGKENLFVLQLEEDEIHEDEAAFVLSRALAGKGVVFNGEPKEGKISLLAEYDGLLKVKAGALQGFNLLGEVMCATRHNNTLVKKGEHLAATRAIPLVIRREILSRAVKICEEVRGVVEVRPLKKAHAGLIITGNEVYTKRIEDKFEPIIRKKINKIGSEVCGVRLAPDKKEIISDHIRELIGFGADLLILTGGMSVDPDDVTRLAVKDAGATEITYGSAVLPGAMFMIAYLRDIPLLGVPGCALFHEITIFDILLPRILAGERIGRKEMASLGHGGLCLNCGECQYPVCPFGKG
ncbi:MAG: molybdopterin-binding protein [Deltaproteobacteria bacterium RBG_16_42_7]|nr:MAG: molybdopterin-binding protein [Deltaproteobacteria bacterium RBG_16_42_7]